MAPDQHTPTDPTTQHPDSTPGQTLTHPGATSRMTPAPDHGEDSYVGTGKLTGRRAVITGGDSGIGRAVAIAYAREGADVMIVHLPDEVEDGRRTVELVESAGRRGVSVPGDIRDESFCQQVVERAVSELGGIDVLVNNAAYQLAIESITDLSTEQLLRTYSTNVFAMFWLSKAAVPHMAPGSSIINTTSITAYKGSPGLIDYASTKGAILAFTRSLSQQLWESRQIRVNAVAPGPIWTPLIPASFDDEGSAKHGASTLLGRAGQPDECAPSYIFLAADSDSGYITGQVLHPNGGSVVNA